MVQISVGDFLIAIIVPGLIMAFLFGSYIVLRAILQPSVAPRYEVSSSISLRSKILSTVKYVMPLAIIIFLVIAYGRSARPVCHLLRGAIAGIFATLLQRPFRCDEVACSAQGRGRCLFTGEAL